jgi:hypothetical protein
VGGFSGYAGLTMITDSYSHSNVSGTDQDIGGFVGIGDQVTIENSYASGSVNGGLTAYNGGGFIGRVLTYDISNSFSTGLVSNFDSDSHGFIGNFSDSGAGLLNNFYDAYTSGLGTGECSPDGDITGQCDFVNAGNSDSEYFKNNDTNMPFVDPFDAPLWDFATPVWDISADHYPKLCRI